MNVDEVMPYDGIRRDADKLYALPAWSFDSQDLYVRKHQRKYTFSSGFAREIIPAYYAGGSHMERTPKLEKDEFIKAFKSSGMKQATWCAQNGVSIHNLRYWLGKEQQPVLPAAGDMQ
jgi:hypothetical protein